MLSRTRLLALAGCLFIVLSSNMQAQENPLPFRTAIELALKNSPTSGIARADLERARAGYHQVRDLFMPQVTLGSGLAFSYGFPLSLEGSAPSIFNVNAQQFFFNQAQRQFAKAAKNERATTESLNADRRNEVIVETAIDYMQLDLLQSSLNVQLEEQEFAARFEDIVNQRVQSGLDSQVDLNRAKLASAKVRLQLTQTKSAMDQLRLRLSQLTGLPAASIQTSTETIPPLPPVSADEDLMAQALSKNPAVKTASLTAQTKMLRATGEEKQLYPSLDLVAQYSVLARYNNYDQFFRKFQRHNVTLGVAIRFPILNSSQRAVADAAKAEATKAQKEAQIAKDQVSSETLKLQRSVQELSAARDVSRLEHQVAETDVTATHEKIQSGAATLKDEQSARVTEHDRYVAYIDSVFQLDKTQVQLLRQTGDLENWALGPKH
ncbi:MAG TPA: TolC family protein [Candidatus Angelobacter sp.]|jgi:outer membrane protein TolC|nr:TolC family protein [Candidatus Angelobacter sp.]